MNEPQQSDLTLYFCCLKPMTATRQMEDFLDWLDGEMDSRSLNDAQLERKAGVGQGVLSNVRSGRRKAGADTLTKIAHALDLPPELVFRQAGVLPPELERTPEQAEVDYLVSQLEESDRQEVLAIVRTIYERRVKKKLR